MPPRGYQYTGPGSLVLQHVRDWTQDQWQEVRRRRGLGPSSGELSRTAQLLLKWEGAIVAGVFVAALIHAGAHIYMNERFTDVSRHRELLRYHAERMRMAQEALDRIQGGAHNRSTSTCTSFLNHAKDEHAAHARWHECAQRSETSLALLAASRDACNARMRHSLMQGQAALQQGQGRPQGQGMSASIPPSTLVSAHVPVPAPVAMRHANIDAAGSSSNSRDEGGPASNSSRSSSSSSSSSNGCIPNASDTENGKCLAKNSNGQLLEGSLHAGVSEGPTALVHQPNSHAPVAPSWWHGLRARMQRLLVSPLRALTQRRSRSMEQALEELEAEHADLQLRSGLCKLTEQALHKCATQANALREAHAAQALQLEILQQAMDVELSHQARIEVVTASWSWPLARKGMRKHVALRVWLPAWLAEDEAQEVQDLYKVFS